MDGLPVKEAMQMECKKNKEKFVGFFDFVIGRRKGKGTLFEDGRGYFVEYDNKGNEIVEKRRRTFEGIRLMIVG